MKFKELLSESYYYDKTGILFNGETIETMNKFDDNSVDMILADLPYGTTACKWDVIIPFDKLWEQYSRIIKPNAVIALTSSQPFTSNLIISNIKNYKYNWVWIKPQGVDPFMSKHRPLNNIEDIIIFSYGKPPYYPQKSAGKPYKVIRDKKPRIKETNNAIMKQTETTNYGDRFPTRTIYCNQEKGLHPTQKPTSLFEYLIKTYTKEDDIVLDNTSGSGTTAISSQNTKRKWICIEKEVKYCAITKERVIENKNE